MSQSEDGKLKVESAISGLSQGTHGFHIHEYGVIDGSCGNTGGHFDPHHSHGTDVLPAGDLDSLVASVDGIVFNEQIADQATMWGDDTILGRSIVLHATAHDHVPKARIACCAIKVAKAPKAESTDDTDWSAEQKPSTQLDPLLRALKKETQQVTGRKFRMWSPKKVQTAPLADGQTKYRAVVKTDVGMVQVDLLDGRSGQYIQPEVIAVAYLDLKEKDDVEEKPQAAQHAHHGPAMRPPAPFAPRYGMPHPMPYQHAPRPFW